MHKYLKKSFERDKNMVYRKKEWFEPDGKRDMPE